MTKWIYLWNRLTDIKNKLTIPKGERGWRRDKVGAFNWKRPRCWARLKAGREGDNRGWDGWMASPTQWGWVWVNSGSWWWTRGPGVLQSMGSQTAGHDWATKLWTFEIIRYRLLYTKQINNKVQLHRTGKYIQYPIINHNGKECKKSIYACICIIYIYYYTHI